MQAVRRSLKREMRNEFPNNNLAELATPSPDIRQPNNFVGSEYSEVTHSGESKPQLPDAITAAEPNREEIAKLAHAYWIERGCPEGSPEIDWLRAEQEFQHKCAA